MIECFREKLMENGVCIRIFGDTTMLPVDLQKLLAQTVLITRFNDKAFLNVCFAYTSRAEMTAAVNDVVAAADNGLIHASDVTADLIRRCFWSSECCDPDLVIRTSGESRLSDFILWQSGYSVIAFVQKLWPEFTIWDLFKAVFFYQRHQPEVSRAMGRSRHRHQELNRHHQFDACRSRQEAAVTSIRSNRIERLEELAATDVAVECG
jgi:ditrans,polycis-polyprenyl diphosphate synthase